MAPLDTTIRQPGPPDAPPSQPWSGFVDDPIPAAGSTSVETDDDGNVTVRQIEADTPKRDESFDENLATRPELEGALSEIAQDILDGIDSDILSRSQFIDNYTAGIDLLGLKIENQSRTKGQKRKTSTVRDTTLLESVVKAQSQARGELLPANGPAKVQTVAEAPEAEDTRAQDFEADLNLALTKGMPEYVPDLDRGLFGFFFGGNMFRYGYHCPLLRRPRVATISVEDLIVSEEATDLDTAMRVTHRAPPMSPNEVKRRMHYGVWRQTDLGSPMPETDAATQKKQEVAGVTSMAHRPQDQPYTFYQTVTDLDLAMHGVKEKGAPEGLPLPYRVTLERYSRQIVRIERFWKQDDEHFARKRRFIQYSMVPGFGFLAYGFLHLQGNQVATLTAVIRLLIDAMMFGAFPGGVKTKGARTETNEIEPGPGEWVELGVPAGIDDIRKVLMALPYKDLSPVAIQLYELVQQACARVGAAAMLETGEGRANMPVGTIMAMLEEKSVVMGAIHKRLHEAMGQELTMLRELFAERPEALAKVLPAPRREWAAAEFQDLELVPASDPNVPSQVHRVMLATALVTLASMPAFQGRLDIKDILQRALRMIGISDSDKLVTDPPAQGDPGAAAAQAAVQKAQIDANSKTQAAQQKEQDSQRKAATSVVDTQAKARQADADAQNDAANRASQEKIALIHEETARLALASKEAQAQRAVAVDHAKHRDELAQTHAHHQDDVEQAKTSQAVDHAHHQDDVATAQQATQARQFGGQGL